LTALYSVSYLHFEFLLFHPPTLFLFLLLFFFRYKVCLSLLTDERPITSISSVCLQEEKAKFQKLAEAKRLRRSKCTKRQKTTGGSASTVPKTPDPDDLIGKRVQHLQDEPHGSTKWYYGRNILAGYFACIPNHLSVIFSAKHMIDTSTYNKFWIQWNNPQLPILHVVQ
jgi:hypothetical protein